MDDRYQRYAIYWTPNPGSGLAGFGSRWFGCVDTFGLAQDLVARGIKAPAVYGLHATLKAPFRLQDEIEPSALQDALDEFCAARRPQSGGPLTLGYHQNYLTLMLKNREADIGWLAAECVTHFDRFRAPLSEHDRNRWTSEGMTAREAGFLEEFGYPYVLSEFRFHISLAGPLQDAELEEAAAALGPHVASFMTEPFQIESLTLLGEPKDGGVFQTVSRHPFTARCSA